MICPHCSAVRFQTFRRGPWSIYHLPLEIGFHDTVLPFRAREAELMALLIREEAVSVEAAHNAATTGPFTAPETATVVISRVRKALWEVSRGAWTISRARSGEIRLVEEMRKAA